LLERAIHAGSGRAVFLLAQTYDPGELKLWKAYGVRADPKKARELYERAYESGIVHAKQRAQALRQR
jgi:TPR repeat protein